MKKLFYILIFIVISSQIHGQTSKTDWKNILTKNKFKVTKDKSSIPLNIFTQIADTITDLANPKEKWDGSCMPNGLPRIKLNWVATDGTNWIVCYTRGGYSAKTFYELFSQNSTETIRNSGWTGEKFKKFKKLYISDKLNRGSNY